MENKKGNLSIIFLIIAIILIVVIGAFRYMQKTNENFFMVISGINENAGDEFPYIYKMITDEKDIGNLINIINSATKYVPNTGAGLLSCPTAEIYDANGRQIRYYSSRPVR